MTLIRKFIAKPTIPTEVLTKWQRTVDLVARIVGVPTCLVKQLGLSDMQVMVASASANNPYQQGDIQSLNEGSYCEAVLKNKASLEIANACNDPDWQHNPNMKQGFVAYFGVPLFWPDGEIFGTLCVLDEKEHQFSQVHRDLLDEFRLVLETDLEKLAGSFGISDESKLWRAIQSAAMESILVMDTQGNFLSANEIAANRFRTTPAELVGKNLYKIIPPDVAENRRKNLGDVLKSKKPMRFEDIRDGRYFNYTAYPVLDEQGNVEKLVVFAADVTERRVTRQALEKSERKYRELVEEASTIILRWDILGNVTFFNEYAQKFFGFSEQEILGKNVVGTIVPETEFTGRDLAHLMEEIRLDPAKFKDNENENIKRNGERVWIAWKNRPIFNEKGELYEIHSVGIDITARKRAEDALRESEALWRSITENSSDHIVTLDENLDIQFVNFASPGLTREELIGTPIYQYVVKERQQEIKQLLEHAFKSGERCSYETEYTDPEGNTIYYESIVAPKIVGDKVVGLTLNSRDVTERKQVQEALRNSEERLRLLVSQADFILWSVDRELKFTSSLGGGLYALGLEPNQVVNSGLNLFQFFQTDSPESWPLRAHLEALDGKPVTYENEWQGRYFQTQVSPQRDSTGDIIGCVGVAIDITDRKQAEEALRESEERQNKAQAVGHVGTWEWKPQTGELVWSDELYRILGFSPREIIPTYELFLSHVHADDREFLENAVNKAFHERQSYNVDVRIMTKSGIEKTANSQATVKYDENGIAIQMLGTFQDITERKKIEKELQQYRSHLEELVAIRTAELETSNKELESYSYSIAHDLRSPLRAITGFSQILKDEAKERLLPEDSEILERIVAAGKNMSELIDDILELSRITRSELRYENVDLCKLGNEIVNRLQQSQPEREVQWQVEDNLLVRGDSRLLEVAMQNLIENAWKYSRDKQPAQIQLGKAKQGKEIVYYLKDNGVGFDMQFQNQLFKPFNRLHALEDFEGTGIGLATVQRIIQRHGGRVWAESEEQKGATFYFTLRNYKTH
ncbi:PAS domain S-box protein [Kaarinaea lacus]